MSTKSHRAFSILELLIVVSIISIVFFLVDVNFNKVKTETKSITKIKTLADERDQKLICYDECSKCGIFELNESIMLNEVKFSDFDENLTSYYIDYEGDILEYEYPSIEIEEQDFDVCFNFRYFKNNSSQKIIVKYFNNYYLFHSFFKDYEIFNTLEDAKNAYISEDRFPQDEDQFYGK
ncbi:MAG: Unknown protein [uncultured Campylobacterales bacterium]|uniref:Prepilin-type N-terminal cleavage/methylation domain-containing protein n=1 Tax=uncultured Campylobacterales bacterium TaxID=352960 RepID=A0A6S6TA88_9BACT|nr:MAG: Unknown protein [uncultured Campylobacterales bacterium]